MEQKTYSEKLKDPRWQKKRLEVFDRDEWMCKNCGDKEGTLNVHHLHYLPGKDPWEYDLKDLLTLCEPCHQTEKDERNQCEDGLLKILRLEKYMAEDIDGIRDFLWRASSRCQPSELSKALRWCTWNTHGMPIGDKVFGELMSSYREYFGKDCQK